MAWNFNYQAGPSGGPFVDILDYAQSARIVGEPLPGGKRGSNPAIPYLDGEFSEPKKWLNAGVLPFDVVLRYTNASGTVTHVDGAAGHVFENRTELMRLLGWGNNEDVWLRRTAPHVGAVETRVECLDPLQAASPRHRYVFPLRMVDAVWREQTLQTDTEASISTFPHAYTINTGGNYEIGDAKITFTCVAAGNNPELTLTGAGLNERIVATGSFATSDVITITLGKNPTFHLNGSRYAPISGNKAWWMRFPPDVTGLGLSFGSLSATTGTWTVGLEWRNKWL